MVIMCTCCMIALLMNGSLNHRVLIKQPLYWQGRHQKPAPWPKQGNYFVCLKDNYGCNFLVVLLMKLLIFSRGEFPGPWQLSAGWLAKTGSLRGAWVKPQETVVTGQQILRNLWKMQFHFTSDVRVRKIIHFCDWHWDISVVFHGSECFNVC